MRLNDVVVSIVFVLLPGHLITLERGLTMGEGEGGRGELQRLNMIGIEMANDHSVTLSVVSFFTSLRSHL